MLPQREIRSHVVEGALHARLRHARHGAHDLGDAEVGEDGLGTGVEQDVGLMSRTTTPHSGACKCRSLRKSLVL